MSKPAARPTVKVVQLQEGAYDKAKGLLSIRILEAGTNRSGTWHYPEKVLERDHAVFRGAKMFANHQTLTEKRERPEGDTWEWVGSIKETSFAPAKDNLPPAAVGVAAIIDPAMQARLERMADHGLLQEQALSIATLANYREADEQAGEKVPVIEALLSVEESGQHPRVDFVTYANAGGQVEALEAARISADGCGCAEAIKTKQQQEAERMANNDGDKGKTPETLVAEANAARAKAEADLKAANEAKGKSDAALKEAQDKTTRAAVAAQVTEAVKKAKLPEPAAKRVEEQFKDALEAKGLDEAIARERAYLREVKAPDAISNPGGEGEGDGKGGDKVDLVESFKAWGLPEDQAKIAARGH